LKIVKYVDPVVEQFKWKWDEIIEYF